ncbi:MAG: hypothetical protein ACYST3_07215 [Planctomycetota bacterium]
MKLTEHEIRNYFYSFNEPDTEMLSAIEFLINGDRDILDLEQEILDYNYPEGY